MGGEFTYPKMVPLVLNHGQLLQLGCPISSENIGNFGRPRMSSPNNRLSAICSVAQLHCLQPCLPYNWLTLRASNHALSLAQATIRPDSRAARAGRLLDLQERRRGALRSLWSTFDGGGGDPSFTPGGVILPFRNPSFDHG